MASCFRFTNGSFSALVLGNRLQIRSFSVMNKSNRASKNIQLNLPMKGALSCGKYVQVREFGNRSTTRKVHQISPIFELIRKSDVIYANNFEELLRLIEADEIENVRYSGMICEHRAVLLGKELEENKNLLALDLKWSNIDNNVAHKLAESLKKNESLICLDLSENQVTLSGALALCRSMMREHSSTIIHLRNNKIQETKMLQQLLENSDHYVVL